MTTNIEGISAETVENKAVDIMAPAIQYTPSHPKVTDELLARYQARAAYRALLASCEVVLRKDVEELVGVATVCAEDLQGELEARYAGCANYPSEKRRFENDMTSVYGVREALAKLTAQPETKGK